MPGPFERILRTENSKDAQELEDEALNRGERVVTVTNPQETNETTVAVVGDNIDEEVEVEPAED